VVQGGDPTFVRMQDQTGASSISIQGAPIMGNNYMIDGISITDSRNRATITPSLDAVQEMKLQISTYDAEVGRTGGGTVSMFLKSGNNQLHGSLYGSKWVQSLMANDFFSNADGIPKSDKPYKTYSGAIGGPVYIPKIYDGRNKTFFFFSMEGYRQAGLQTRDISIPTALEREGNFSESYNDDGSLRTIYNPFDVVDG
jgi:hypothetical protein